MTTQLAVEHDSGYADAAGVRTYYETRGSGDPLLLLHGGMCTIETLDGLATHLSNGRRVVMPERRGHGRTPDVPGPLTYDVMAQDTIAFLDVLGMRDVPMVGWSDGAVVAMLVALQRPDLVRSLVLIGQGANHDGDPDELREMLATLGPDDALPIETLPPMFQQAYAAVSPDGAGHFPVVFERLSRTWRTEPSIPLDALEAIESPTLILIGDQDMVTVAHADAMRRAMPHAQLGVVPGATHGLPMEMPELVSQLILGFLEAEPR